jgi:hypothetical protein
VAEAIQSIIFEQFPNIAEAYNEQRAD